MQLDTARARQALEEAGRELDLDLTATAWGIHDIVNENMASAARTHIAEKGLDARDFTLVATGGAGPVHAVDVARRLRIKRILCPIASGVGSCLGFLSAPARSDRSWSRVEGLDTLDTQDFMRRLEQAAEAIEADLAACGLKASEVGWNISAEIRYAGQGNTVTVPVADHRISALDRAVVLSRFEEVYLKLYRKLIPAGVPEIVTWRVSGSSTAEVMRFSLAQTAARSLEAANLGTRRIYLPGTHEYSVVPVYDRYRLPEGTQLATPAVVVEPESTLVVSHGGQLSVLDGGTIEVVLDETGSN